MDSARPTKEFKTGGGHVVVFNEYITGEENRQIRAIYIRSIKKPDESKDAAEVEFEADNKMFELAIVSVDGHTDDIVKRVLALPLRDFKEVVAETSELNDGKKKSEKP